MSQRAKKSDGGVGGGAQGEPQERLELAAIGMEAEFELYLDDQLVKPEDAFGSPRAFIRGPLMHRTGTSYHLPTGGAVYFDTGVIELATPVIEIERYAKIAARTSPAFWIRPYGHGKGQADDHLHLDIGYAVVTPRGRDEYLVR